MRRMHVEGATGVEGASLSLDAMDVALEWATTVPELVPDLVDLRENATIRSQSMRGRLDVHRSIHDARC